MFFKHILTQVMAIILGKMIRQTPIIGWLEKEENGGVYIKKDTGVGWSPLEALEAERSGANMATN